MKDNLTEIVCILDESGSMRSLRKDTVEGYNSFIDSQKEQEGEAKVTTILFNGESRILHDRIDVKEVPEMKKRDYSPRGSTSLLDALGSAIDRTGKILSDTPEEERPSKVIFMIVTDGEENTSTEYTYQDVKDRVTHQQDKYSWSFIFVGANIDSYSEGMKLGFYENNISNYTANQIGTESLYKSISNAVCDYRVTGNISNDWKNGIL